MLEYSRIPQKGLREGAACPAGCPWLRGRRPHAESWAARTRGGHLPSRAVGVGAASEARWRHQEPGPLSSVLLGVALRAASPAVPSPPHGGCATGSGGEQGTQNCFLLSCCQGDFFQSSPQHTCSSTSLARPWSCGRVSQSLAKKELIDAQAEANQDSPLERGGGSGAPPAEHVLF